MLTLALRNGRMTPNEFKLYTFCIFLKIFHGLWRLKCITIFVLVSMCLLSFVTKFSIKE